MPTEGLYRLLSLPCIVESSTGGRNKDRNEHSFIVYRLLLFFSSMICSLNDGQTAPSDTLEEVIESLAQREIAQTQLHYREQFDNLTSKEFAEGYFQVMADQQGIEELFEAHKSQNIQELQNNKEFEIQAILQLRDYRIAGLHETYLQ